MKTATYHKILDNMNTYYNVILQNTTRIGEGIGYTSIQRRDLEKRFEDGWPAEVAKKQFYTPSKNPLFHVSYRIVVFLVFS